MDPNGGKKNLFNKLGRKEAIKRLNEETFKRVTVSFYKYVMIQNPAHFRDVLFARWHSCQAFGRIYVAKEGINAQMSVPEFNWKNFVKDINTIDELKEIPFKIAIEDD